MSGLTTWFHFDSLSKFEDLVKFTNGAVYKDSNGYCIKQGNNIIIINIGDYVGKKNDESTFLILDGSFVTQHHRSVFVNNTQHHSIFDMFPCFLKKPKPIRSQSELYNERLDEIVNAITRYKEHKMAIPEEWIKEYNMIIEIIRNQ